MVRLLNIIALGALVDLRVKLLLSASVAVLALFFILTVGRITPLIALLDARTRRGAVVEVLRRSTTVLVVVILRTGISMKKKKQVSDMNIVKVIVSCGQKG